MSNIPPTLPEDREPDELDALLRRTEAPLQDGPQRPPRIHRKTRSVSARTVQAYPSNAGRHRKNKSSVSELITDAFHRRSLDPIKEDFQSAAKMVREEFVHGLDEMDQGKTGYYDMTVTRSLSVLPDDIADLVYEVGIPDQEPDDQPVPLLQYALLLLAVVAISSNSTVLHKLEGVAPPLKLFWRMSSSYFALVPFAYNYFRRDGFPDLTIAGWLTFLTATACYAAQGVLFYTSLTLTSIGNAVIYANSQALLLIVGKVCVGERIHVLEGVGVVVAFTGAILCSKDSEETSTESSEESHAIYGDALALASAVAGVAYLTSAKAVRTQMSVTVFIFLVMTLGSLMVLLYIALDPAQELSWDFDPDIGVFGGFNPERIPFLFILAVLVNMVGTMGFVRSMEYFDTVIIAVATLIEPLMASFIAYIFHAGLLPGPLGWFGNMLVVLGTLTVVYPSMGKKGGGDMH
eukprot:Nitzschia sp. Nitz4//NODE_293_length_29386_cov_71.949235//23873//25258//NITZ4_additional_000039-RA//-1//CDS//3329531839//7324//frame0